MRFLSPLVVGSLLLACSADTTEPASDEAEQLRLGASTLRVTNPNAARVSKVFAQRQTDCPWSGCPVMTIPLNSDVRLTSGTYCLQTEISDVVGDRSSTVCGITLAPGSVTTHALGAVRFVRPRGEKLVMLDGDPTSSEAALLRNTEAVAHPAGQATYYPSYSDRVDVTIREGELQTIDLTDVRNRYAARFRCEAGALPNAVDGEAGAIRVFGTAEIPLSCGGDTWLLRLARDGRLELTLRSPGGWPIASLPATLSRPGESVAEVRLPRLDVPKPSVTDMNGNALAVEAMVTVVGDPMGSSQPVVSFSAGSGINLLPGTYSVKTEYTSPIDGTPVREQRDVTLPAP